MWPFYLFHASPQKPLQPPVLILCHIPFCFSSHTRSLITFPILYCEKHPQTRFSLVNLLIPSCFGFVNNYCIIEWLYPPLWFFMHTLFSTHSSRSTCKQRGASSCTVTLNNSTCSDKSNSSSKFILGLNPHGSCLQYSTPKGGERGWCSLQNTTVLNPNSHRITY